MFLTGLLLRCLVDLKKMQSPAIMSERHSLLDISLSQPKNQSVEPSDPFMALKYAVKYMLKLLPTTPLSSWSHSRSRAAAWGGTTVFWMWRASRPYK